MSDFVVKTVGTLSNLFSNVSVTGGDEKANKTGFSTSYAIDMVSFMRKMKNATSKNGEEAIVSSYLALAEKMLAQPNVKESEIENCVKLAMVCELLGYSAPFVYVHAIKLTQKGNLQQKHTGYIAAASLLNPGHELIILLINTIQKDLESPNDSEVILGLKAVCNLICKDTVHNVMYLVKERLTHRRAEVRKLAVLALNHCLGLVDSESAYKLALPKLETCLCDSDLSVVSVALPVICKIIKKYPGDYTYLIDGMVQLQSQILQRRVPREMEYQGLPAPWLQIDILRFFAVLCDDAKKSEKVFQVLKETLQKSELNHNICYAIVAEFVHTVIALNHSEEMLQLALSSSAKLLNSETGNLRYIGIQAFTAIVQKVKPNLTPAHQESIMQCINHPDSMLKKKAFELLYFLANPSNTKAICKKMMHYLSSESADDHIKKDIALKIIKITRQYNDDDKWYIHTINETISKAGSLLPESIIFVIIDYINSESDSSLKSTAKEIYFNMCLDQCPLAGIVKILSSVLDEPSEFQTVLSRIYKEADEISVTWLLTALQTSIMKFKSIPPDLPFLLKTRAFQSQELQQLLMETQNLINEISSMENMEFHTEIDPTLSFLDDYVNESLMNGARCYVPRRLRAAELIGQADFENFSRTQSSTNSKASFLWDSEAQKKDSASTRSFSFNSLSSSSLPAQTFCSPTDVTHGSPKARTVWTKEGRSKQPKDDQEKVKPTSESQENVTTEELFAGLSS